MSIWKAPKGMTSVENRDDIFRHYRYRDGRCPYCKRYPIHVGWKGPNDPGEIQVRLGSTLQAEAKEQSFSDRAEAYRPEDRVVGRPEKRRLPDGRYAFRCFVKCGELLGPYSEDQLRRWWAEAVENNQRFFELPTRPSRV